MDFFKQWSCYVTFKNYIRNLSFPLHWTFCFFSAIAFWSLITWFRCDFFIMSIDGFWHIVHATVADFNCFAVKHFVKFVVFRKMFCYHLKKYHCKLCVETDLIKGGLNHIIFRFRVFDFSDLLLAYFKSTLKPDFFSASSYLTFTVLKMSWLEEFFGSLSKMEFGNCLMICGGWFDDEWM